MTAPVLALILQCAFLLVALVLRTLMSYLRTGTTGVRVQRRTSMAQRIAVALLVTGALAPLAAAPLQHLDALSPLVESRVLVSAGTAIAVAGLVLVLVSQEHMGDSWRIGVDPTETTVLVATGPFRYVRNPIFSGMLIFWVGVALIIPNVLSLVGLAAAFVGVEAQVRLVEEPYLLRTHADVYKRYAATTGRLVPLIGKLR